jgi:hypothetical protein
MIPHATMFSFVGNLSRKSRQAKIETFRGGMSMPNKIISLIESNRLLRSQ